MNTKDGKRTRMSNLDDEISLIFREKKDTYELGFQEFVIIIAKMWTKRNPKLVLVFNKTILN